MDRDIQRAWGHLRYIRKVGRDEWRAECPNCGTSGHDWSNPSDPPDRFHMHPATPAEGAWGACRQCGHFEWADENYDSGVITESELRRRQKRVKRYEQKESDRFEKKLSRFRESQPWVTYHEQLTDQGREMWRQEGVPDNLQNRLMLGEGKKQFYDKGGSLNSGHALTIPYFDTGWEAIQLQYRLTNPPKGAGKYRWTSGLGSQLYLTDPDEGVMGTILMAEGAKKAIVSYLELVLRGDQRHLTVVAVPSKSPSPSTISRLEWADLIYICLDPDAEEVEIGDETAVERAVRMIGNERARVVTLPDKIDDLIVKLGATWRDIMPYLERARKP